MQRRHATRGMCSATVMATTSFSLLKPRISSITRLTVRPPGSVPTTARISLRTSTSKSKCSSTLDLPRAWSDVAPPLAMNPQRLLPALHLLPLQVENPNKKNVASGNAGWETGHQLRVANTQQRRDCHRVVAVLDVALQRHDRAGVQPDHRRVPLVFIDEIAKRPYAYSALASQGPRRVLLSKKAERGGSLRDEDIAM